MKNPGWGVFLSAVALLAASACVSTAQEAVLYSFQPGSSDGQSPNGGPAIDKEGNLYGTTATGGTHGSGIVYELSPPSQSGGDWTETVIYNFGDVPAAGGSPGITGQGGTVILDDNGNLYGTAIGGVSNVSGVLASGVVYELSPPSSGSGEWTAQALYTFLDESSKPEPLKGPNGAVVFDRKGNLYGIAYGGGANSNGGVFELSPPTQVGAQWTMTSLYSFDKTNGAGPWGPGENASLIVDSEGDLYGTTQYGGAASSGTVYELSPPTGDAGNWTSAIIHSFKEDVDKDGYGPLGSLAMDAKGNLYGTTGAQGSFAGGIVFELSPPESAGGGWTENILENFTAFSKTDGYGPFANVVLDPQGNLWGATYYGGPNYTVDSANSDGAIFELIPQSEGTWTEALPVPYFFGSHANDVYHPNMPIIIDGKGNIYSTATGGASTCNDTGSCGAVWEYIPPAPVITVSFAPAPGTYSNPVSVSMSPSLEGAIVYYTTDGSAPTTSSPVYISPIDVRKNTTIKAIAVNDTDTSAVATDAYTIQAAKPVISPPGGLVPGAQQVIITDTTPGAAIHYTTNGQAPTTSSPVYAKPFKVVPTQTVSAIAIATDYGNSPVVRAEFTQEKPAAAPVFSVKTGTYAKAFKVAISDTTSGATIYYSTNGATPSKNSTRYTGPISVSANETVQAIAIARNHLASKVTWEVYTIETAVPTITPDGGTFSKAQTVTLKDATAGATIYYTANGATPTTSSTRYTGAFAVRSKETVRAMAIAPYHASSAVTSAGFTIE
jgi:uncharacterized repeat protein (TIGR03803 family)